MIKNYIRQGIEIYYKDRVGNMLTIDEIIEFDFFVLNALYIVNGRTLKYYTQFKADNINSTKRDRIVYITKDNKYVYFNILDDEANQRQIIVSFFAADLIKMLTNEAIEKGIFFNTKTDI